MHLATRRINVFLKVVAISVCIFFIIIYSKPQFILRLVAQVVGAPSCPKVANGICYKESAVAPPLESSSPALEVQASPPTKIPYGTAISSCVVEGDFALTFDDGPTKHTDKILDLLKEAGFKATFFVNGELVTKIMEEQPRIRRILAEGHQLGHHTYHHTDLVKITNEEIVTEMTLLEDTLLNITGKYPTYMRFPYFAFDERTLAAMKELEYHTIWADIDTNDWKYNNLGNFTGLDIFNAGLEEGGSISL